ncbi:MAG: tRNA lysidine(34) synthetase TilS, partial [Firmicutes bacterium]|nr:tRNA lysidine(34) synthetase TilS [Bacillota bacterium]
MLQKGDTILAGASGGADSTALLHFLTRLRDEYELKLCAVYVNHRIRGEEAYEDAHFAEELCSALNVEFFYEEADVPEFARANRISEEEAGRMMRYRIFNEILEKKGGGKIALGHNLNDNAETVLIRLARGTGPKGLEGIPPVR